jgi:PAS fold
MSAETSYRAVAEHLPDAAVVLLDRDLRLQLATGTTLPEPAWCADHHVGRTMVDLVPAEQAERLTASYRAALAGSRQHLETPGWRGQDQYWAPLDPEVETALFRVAQQAFAHSHGFGLACMRERVQAIGGQSTLDSAPGAGTRIQVRAAARAPS